MNSMHTPFRRGFKTTFITAMWLCSGKKFAVVNKNKKLVLSNFTVI